MMTGRIVPVVFNDRESESRTPSRPLYLMPVEARDLYTAMPPLPSIGSSEADLTRTGLGRPKASGEAIVIRGQVFDEDHRPVRGALIEIWNANTFGRYSHSADTPRTQAPLDPNFYGFGRLLTDDNGSYRLRTIKP